MKKPNMALKAVIFVILIIAFLKIEITSSQQVVCSDSTRSLERGEQAVISCQYPMNFIGVFWYRGQAENPFLRLEGGRPTPDSGFSIDSSGSMTIENVQLDHEGTYRISVLDSNGVSTSATVDIYVKVSLKSDPQLESCSTSQHDLCRDFNEKERTTILICYTTETRPAVNFMWSKLSSSGPVNVTELRSNSSMNSSTELCMSSSLFRYDKNDFSLQYFTCLASGQAVMDERSTAKFVEGNEDVQSSSIKDQIIRQGESLQIRCSENSFKLSKWTFTNDTVNTIKEFYPGEEGGSCLFGSKCNVNEQGVLLIPATTYENEGSYTCTYGNGETTRKQITKVSIIVNPNPEIIIIEGCTDTNDCNKNVALTGRLEVSVTGARPFIELKCEITEEAKSQGFIFDDRNSKIVHPESGTFDTVYNAEFEIDECSEPLRVVCKVEGNSVHNTLSPSHVNLVTDVSNCGKRRPGLAVFLVFLVILVAAAIIAFVLYRRNPEWAQKHLRRSLRTGPEHVTEEEREEALIDTEQHVQEPDEERGEGVGGYTESESVEESSQPPKSDELTSAFQEFCDKLKETKRVPVKQFEGLMELYHDRDQSQSPIIFLVNRMVKDNFGHEMISIVLSHLVELTPNRWVPILDFCKLLEGLTLTNELSSGSSIQLFVALCKDKKINLTTYVDETGRLFQSGKLDDITLITNLRGLLSNEVITQDDLVENILQYVILYKMKEKTALEEVKYLERSENKVPYPMFLRAINKCYKLGTCNDMLFRLFDNILEEFLTPQSLALVNQRVSDEKEVISCVYLEVLLCSVVDKKIPLETAIDMLISGIKHREVHLSDYEIAYEKGMQNKKITPELQRELPLTFLRMLKELAPEDRFEETSLRMINRKEIPLKLAIDMLKSRMENKEVLLSDFEKAYEKCKQNEKITAELQSELPRTFLRMLKEVAPENKFEETSLQMINSKEFDKMFWITFIVDLWKEGLVNKKLRPKLILEVARTYLMLKEEFKEPLDKMLDRDDRKDFLTAIKFKDSEIRKIREK